MALILKGVTRCALTGKVLGENDRFLCFAPFDCELDDPAIVCQDGCVLREAFDVWEHKKRVLELARAFTVSNYHRNSHAFAIHFENSHYLIVQSKIEPRVRLFLHDHAFMFDIEKKDWAKFVEKLAASHTQVETNITSGVFLLLFKNTRDEIEITQRIINGYAFGEDCIRIPHYEWEAFCSAIATLRIG